MATLLEARLLMTLIVLTALNFGLILSCLNAAVKSCNPGRGVTAICKIETIGGN